VATLQLSEAIIDAMITKLSAGLAARVTAINAADTAGVTIHAPTRFLIGGPDDGIPPPEPAIVFVEIGASQEYTEEGPHAFMYQADIAVFSFELDTSRAQLARKLLRQSRAVIEVLWDDAPKESLTGAANRCFPVRHIPGPTFDPNANSQWSGLFGVVFRCLQLAA
jgi:hypothetical protein